MRTIALLLCALAFALLGAGCGDDDSDTTTSEGAAAGATSGDAATDDGGGGGGSESDEGGEELSSEEFVSQATEICKEASEEFQKEFKAIANRGKQEGGNPRKTLGESVAKAFNTELDEIGALTPPAGDEAEVEAILNALREATEGIEANPAGLQQVGAQVNKARNLASKYGIKGCPLGG